MSRYEDWKEMVCQWYKGEALEELHKIIDKAEKYDELIADNKVLTKLVWLKYGTSLNDKTTESLLDKYEEECHYMFAEKEKTLVENQILKEGIKALDLSLGYDEGNEAIGILNGYCVASITPQKELFILLSSTSDNKEEVNRYNKIKKMLEVIEDERKDKSIHKKDI